MKIHVIKSGESLWRIAAQYGSDLNQIILANQFKDPSVLVVGQSIVIPEPGSDYVVEAGDTLGKIAFQSGVSVEELAHANNITDPTLIHVGELLKLPYSTYTVQAGDTLWAIGERFNVSVNNLIQLNHLTNPSQLTVGQDLRIPQKPRPIKEVNAYTTAINERGRDEVLLIGNNFTYLSPFMYSVKEDGSLTSMQEEALLNAAKVNDVAPLLALTNFRNNNFDSDLAATILGNPTLQNTLINNLLQTMRAKGYRGLNIDFEYVYPEDQKNYNDFLRRLAARLRPEGFLLSTAVAPKESGDQQGLLYEAHDYAAHGEIVDFVIIMTYEWGWAGGRPWAIAPINKVRDVLDYAVTVIPRQKIMMGAPLYGRDWKVPWQEGTFARTVSPEGAVDLAARNGVSIQYNDTYQSPFFRYTDNTGQEHEVWFEDARSMQVKYETVKKYGIRGVSYWVLGNDFPQNWPVLKNEFKVRKV